MLVQLPKRPDVLSLSIYGANMDSFHNDLSGNSMIGIQAGSIQNTVLNQTFNQTLHEQSWKGKLSNIPRPASKNFTGREALLTRLQNCLVRRLDCEIDGIEGRVVFVLYGLGGSGKTQVALKFAEIQREKFEARFWIDARDAESVNQSYSEIAELSEAPDGRALLEYKENWLLIIDNADDASKDLGDCFPPGDRGAILVTSRNPDHLVYASEDMSYQMDGMNLDDSSSLLLKVARKRAAEQYRSEAKELVEKLELLPLAISQAGAAIHQKRFSIREYSQAYESNHRRLLTSHSTQGTESYGFSVFATWKISLDMIEAENSDMAKKVKEVLNIASHFHHGDVPRYLINSAQKPATHGSAGAIQMGLRKFQSVFSSIPFFRHDSLVVSEPPQGETVTVDDALLTLASYSLVILDNECISMHSLVQYWARYELASQALPIRQWAQQAASAALDSSIESGDTIEQHEKRRKLYPHVRSFVELDTGIMKVEATAATLAKFAQTAFDTGNFTMAESLYKESLDLLKAKSWFSKKTSESLDVLESLASAQERRGAYKNAMENAEQVVRGRASLLGGNHIKTWRAMAKLALTHQGMGDIGGAGNINQSLLVKIRSLDSTNQDAVFTAEVMQNHGEVLSRQGKYSDAVDLLEEALKLRESSLGLEHPETLETMASLADMFGRLDKWKEAHELVVRTYEMRQKILGETHPDTLSSLRGLGNVYYHQGRYIESVEVQEHVLESRKSTLGAKHPDTIITFNELAKVQLGLGRYESAETNFGIALREYEERYGIHHPNLLIIRSNLAVCFRRQKKYEQAVEMSKKTLEEFERRGESDHPDALTCRSYLAVTLHEECKFAEAEEMKRVILKAHETTSGLKSAATFRSLQSLAYTVAKDPSRYQEADDMMKRAVEGLEDTLGFEDHSVLNAICQRAHVLRRSKKYEDSWLLFRRACSLAKKVGDEDHWCFHHLKTLEESMSEKGIRLPVEEATYDDDHVKSCETTHRTSELSETGGLKRRRSPGTGNSSDRAAKAPRAE